MISLSMLVMGGLIIPASRIGNRRGHARMIALGAALLVSDAVVAVSPSLIVLLVGEALIAAIGGALILPGGMRG